MCKCTCNECDCCESRKVVDQPPNRPYRCENCGSIEFFRIHELLTSCLRPHCGECGEDMEFAGFEAWENGGEGGLRNRRYESLQEGHNWEDTGMLNPHAIPMRDTPMWQKYMAEGRIVKDPRTGHEVLYSKNHKEYVNSLKDMGVHNAYGEGGDLSKSRQAGEHLHHD